MGDRVRVSFDYHWAKGAIGVITSPIEEVSALTPERLEGERSVVSRMGMLTFYWVDFDEPQLDADGDGPYSGGEIDDRYLELCKPRRVDST